MSLQAPRTEEYMVNTPAVATGASATTSVVEAPYAGSITEVKYVPVAAVTGVNTNTRRVSLVNKGQAGAGNTEMAFLQFDAGVNGVAFDASLLTLSATPANRNFVEGDILAWVSAAVGSGLADPGGEVIAVLSRS